uniref:Protein ASPARTIC PROTEASE IN GUARD CELL 1-like n=1 Tax=Nicotiana sylvestris TaxID=4096 RepID=A0A1U7WFM9_NICSY|nr:PREDICTED: protein ASPARTIC PROTEASE IN GUARD CELL 1-like [Nicotiana sylvestris]XP_016445367.1 PREDICTED: protein ASPARTIC PROTEASE IN GUARD CELL 1-like [Nicotiana tabacum]
MSFDISKLQDPPMLSYSFSVYHIDVFEKSKFTDYDSVLTNRLAQDHARATYLASKFKYRDTEIKKDPDFQEKYAHNLSKNHDQTLKVAPTSYYQSHYVALFMLGSERIRNYLLIDTGSYLVWWQCAPCVPNKCFKQVFNTIYNRTTSKTFKRLYCVEDSSVCIAEDPHFHCALSSSLCFYETTYGSGQTTKGFMQSEVIIFPSDNTQARINFGCSIDQRSGSQDFSGTFSGIAGLGRRVSTNAIGGYSLPSQLGSSIFALCLPSSTSVQPSVLTFNKAPWSYGTEVKLVKNPLNPHFYNVNIFKIVINDKVVPVEPSWWNNGNQGVIVDTGTLITRFPHDFYIIFRDVFRLEVKDYEMVEDGVGPFDTCYKDDPFSAEVYFPVVRFYFGNISPSQELMVKNAVETVTAE